MAYHPPGPAASEGSGAIADLQRLLDPRLEWVHDKPIGRRQDQAIFNTLGVAWKVLAGQAEVRTAHGHWRAGAGTWVLLQPGNRFQAFADGTRMWSIGYRFNRTRGPSWYVGPDVVLLQDCPRLDLAGQRLIGAVETAVGQRPIGARMLGGMASALEDYMRVEAAFRGWLAEEIAVVSGLGLRLLPSAHHDDRIRQALAAIARDPWGPDSAPEELARALRLSRRRLEQLFAGQIGHGIAEERMRRRVELASELLVRRDLQIKQVAARCRIARSSTFSAWFRRHAGVTPRTFRRGYLVGGT